MKKFAILILMIASLWACSKSDDPNPNNPKPDYSNMKAEIRNGSKLKAADDVIKRAATVMFNDRWIGTAEKNDSLTAIIIPSCLILTVNNSFDDLFVSGFNFIMRDINGKVIAYVPNKDMRIAEPFIVNAFKKGLLDSCVYYLKTKYKFIPITDAEWQKLKAEGKN